MFDVLFVEGEFDIFEELDKAAHFFLDIFIIVSPCCLFKCNEICEWPYILEHRIIFNGLEIFVPLLSSLHFVDNPLYFAVKFLGTIEKLMKVLGICFKKILLEV